MTAAYKRAPVRVAAALVLLSAVLLAIGSVVTSHPAVCTLCHGGHADAMATSAHRGIPCYDCHLPAGGWSIIDAKTDEFLSMYPAYASGRRVGQSGSGSRISRAACTACHLGVLSGTTKAKDLKIVHATCASEQGKCDTCHSEVAHPGAVRWPRSIDMGVCLGCHDSKSASVQCATCHAKKVAPVRPVKGSLQAAHGSTWKSAHGLADLRTCTTCHEPPYCVKCHGTTLPHPGGFMATHGKEAMKPGAACATCHSDRSVCDSCHGIEMPHPVNWRPKHAAAATARSDPKCLKCHDEFDCRNCHAGHAHPGTTKGTLGTKRLPSSRSVR
jgi:hypothetical protein